MDTSTRLNVAIACKGDSHETGTSVFDKTKSISIQIQLSQSKKRGRTAKLRCPCRSSKCKQNARHSKKATDRTAHDPKLERIGDNVALIQQVPTNGLAAEFVTFLEDMHFTSSFYSFVPSRLGQSDAVDSAARAVAQAYETGQFNQATADYALPAEYIKAVQSLRQSVDGSDESLITIMLLILFERIVSDAPRNVLAHLGGLTAILQSRSGGAEVTEIERAVLYDNKSITHWIPLYTMAVSPFENERWLSLRAATCSSELPAPLGRLAHLAYQLEIRLPRLVNYVRALKDRTGTACLRETIALAKDLSTLDDKEAENIVLHRLRIERTKEPIDKVFVAYSFKFNALQEFDAVTAYWQVRILLGTLCCVLLSVAGAEIANSCFDGTTSRSESVRMTSNLLMSMQYSEAQGIFVRRRLAQALEMSMGTLAGTSEYRGLPICQVRSWLAGKISGAFGKTWKANCFTTGGE